MDSVRTEEKLHNDATAGGPLAQQSHYCATRTGADPGAAGGGTVHGRALGMAMRPRRRLNTPGSLSFMGRILSGRNRGMDVANPGSGGAAGMCRRSRVRRDVGRVTDDMITILKMSPDDRLKEHVRRQVARVVEYDGGHVGAGAACGGGGGGGGGGADAAGPAVDAGAGREEDAGSDEEEFHDDLEDEVWGGLNE